MQPRPLSVPIPAAFARAAYPSAAARSQSAGVGAAPEASSASEVSGLQSRPHSRRVQPSRSPAHAATPAQRAHASSPCPRSVPICGTCAAPPWCAARERRGPQGRQWRAPGAPGIEKSGARRRSSPSLFAFGPSRSRSGSAAGACCPHAHPHMERHRSARGDLAECPPTILALSPRAGERTPAGPTPLPRAGERAQAGPTPLPRAGERVPNGPAPSPRAGERAPAGPTPLPRAGERVPNGTAPSPRAGEHVPAGPAPPPRAGERVPAGPAPFPRAGERSPAGPTPCPPVGEVRGPAVPPVPPTGVSEGLARLPGACYFSYGGTRKGNPWLEELLSCLAPRRSGSPGRS